MIDHATRLEILRIIAAAPAIVLLWAAAFQDVARRIIPNRLVLWVMAAGVVVRIASSFLLPLTPLESIYALAWTFGFGVVLFMGWQAGLIAPGDIKLWFATTLIVPASAAQQEYFLAGVFIAGGVVSAAYLAVKVAGKWQPRIIAPAGRGAWIGLRLWRIEQRRVRRGIGVPYGVAIALSATVTLLALPMTGPGWLSLT